MRGAILPLALGPVRVGRALSVGDAIVVDAAPRQRSAPCPDCRRRTRRVHSRYRRTVRDLPCSGRGGRPPPPCPAIHLSQSAVSATDLLRAAAEPGETPWTANRPARRRAPARRHGARWRGRRPPGRAFGHAGESRRASSSSSAGAPHRTCQPARSSVSTTGLGGRVARTARSWWTSRHIDRWTCWRTVRSPTSRPGSGSTPASGSSAETGARSTSRARGEARRMPCRWRTGGTSSRTSAMRSSGSSPGSRAGSGRQRGRRPTSRAGAHPRACLRPRHRRQPSETARPAEADGSHGTPRCGPCGSRDGA